MAPPYFPLRWESTGDHWWYASPIDWAAANGHHDVVLELLRLDSNHLINLTSLRRIRRLETVWDDDEEQFHDVAKCRARVARKLLIESGKNSLIRAGYGGWVLYTAASAGDLGFVKEMLEKDPLLVFGEGEYGVTDMLYAAARSKNCDVFRVLFDFAASPRFLAANGRGFEERIGVISAAYKWEMMNRAIHASARGGNLKILKELLGDCSDVLAYRDIQGSTVLHAAAGRGQVEVVKDLITSFDIVDSTDDRGNTALHVAAYRGQLATVEALILASPSSIHLRNNSGETFLHMAVSGFQISSFHRLDRQIELVKQLVSTKMFNIDEIINVTDNEGRTVLHVAIIGNFHSDLVEELMSVRSINVNTRDFSGMTPLDLLRGQPRSASSEKVTKHLISAGGIFNCRDYEARRAVASNLRVHGIGSSPGTSFKISDTEMFLFTGIEKTSSSDTTVENENTCNGEATIESESENVLTRKKSGSVSYTARRLKRLLHLPNMKEKSTNSGEIPTTLRKRFSKPSSLPNNKRVLSVRSNIPSPISKKKPALGVLNLIPKHGLTSKRLMNPYFCFGAVSSKDIADVEEPEQTKRLSFLGNVSGNSSRKVNN